MSNIAVHVYSALQLMQAKVLPINFEDKNFTDGQLYAKSSKITSLKNLNIYNIAYTAFILASYIPLASVVSI